jgi:hypothetical protein
MNEMETQRDRVIVQRDPPLAHARAIAQGISRSNTGAMARACSGEGRHGAPLDELGIGDGSSFMSALRRGGGRHER